MLTYVFEESGIPLYEQAYRCIKNDIISGNLRSGEKLPSKRTFADNNGISTITIQNAYDQLISEGYVYTIPKKGYYVADIGALARGMAAGTGELVNNTSRSTSRNTFQNSEAKIPDIRMPKRDTGYRIDLSSNRMGADSFPFTVWAKLSRETISARSRELMKVPPTCGIYELRAAIAAHLRSFRGMVVDPDQIIVGAGTEYLYGLLVQLLGADKGYCIENPGYKKLAKIYKQYNIECRYASMDDKGITVEELTKTGADIAHICPNHHFPTGITMPASRRYEILAWANDKNGRYIIEDDYDSEFRTNGRPLPTLFSIDACEKVIYMNTFSKSLTPTIRISYMILPPHLANRFYSELSFYACTVSTFEQYTLAAFISRGYFEKHINRMRLYYSRQRKRLLDSLQKSRLSRICSVNENESGLHFLIRLNTAMPEQEIARRLKKAGIHLQSLSEYFLVPDKSKEYYYIISYSDVDVDDVQEAFDEIYRCVEEDSGLAAIGD